MKMELIELPDGLGNIEQFVKIGKWLFKAEPASRGRTLKLTVEKPMKQRRRGKRKPKFDIDNPCVDIWVREKNLLTTHSVDGPMEWYTSE